jgi:hypothetical protein
MSKIVRLFDRSRTVTDWACPRKRYWNYEYAGRGIVPAGNPIELFLGTAVHDALATIAAMTQTEEGVDIDLVATTAQKQVYDTLLGPATDVETVAFAAEQAALIEGMIRGFHKHVWPRLTAAYPVIIAIEQEITYTVSDGLVFMSKPDLVVADADGNWYYIEYKTTSSKKDNWTQSWSTAVQLHSTMRAIEQTLGTKPVGVIVQGLYKGYESYGKQGSPFCYAYRRNAMPPFDRGETSYEYKAGLRRTPTWELDGGVKHWVEHMPDNILTDQFPCTPVIFINDDLVDSFFDQRTYREMEIAGAGPEIITEEVVLNRVFPQRFDQCIPYFGRPCAYRPLCFGVVADPLKQGYTLREPHHDPERQAQEAAGETTTPPRSPEEEGGTAPERTDPLPDRHRSR